MADRGNQIWVDADACPVALKDMLFKAANRAQVRVTLVANQPLQVPTSPYIQFRQVARGFDVADNEIHQRVNRGDLVITGDIPLAADVIDKGATALNSRGELYTADNIRARLNMRDFLDNLRASGVDTGGPAALNAGDRQRFANALDRWLSQRPKPLP